MEFFKPLAPVISVFLLVAVGFVFARWKKISLGSVTEIIVYLGTPCLVFTSLASRPLFAADIAVLFAGVIVLFAGVGLLIWLYFLIFRFRSRGFALPVLFMNAGNMGIPLALFAFWPARHAAGNFGFRHHHFFSILAWDLYSERQGQLVRDFSSPADLCNSCWTFFQSGASHGP